MPTLSEWSYEDYKRVAEKHYKTCLFLKSQLNNIDNEEKKEAIIFDLFYLSGYVIECLLKYYILLHNHLEGRQQKGVLTSIGIWKHNLRALSQKASENNGIDLDFNNKSELFRSWDSEIRYDYNFSATQDDLISYFENEVINSRTLILSAV